MMTKRRIIYSPVHFKALHLYFGRRPQLYMHYKNYFLGDTFEALTSRQAHLDLTTQSLGFTGLTETKPGTAAAKAIQQFTYKASLFYYKKLRFTGKGYKIKKSRLKKSFKLYFGYSHKQYLFSGGLRYKKLSKYRLLLVSNNKKRLNRVMALSLNARPLNRYTKRGFRSTRQFILKRPGKKSSH